MNDHIVPIIPIAIGLGFFGLQWIVSRGRWVGSCDILLGGALGMLLGTWQAIVIALWFAYIVGMLTVVIMIPFRTLDLNKHVAFGPFLVLGAVIALFFGDAI